MVRSRTAPRQRLIAGLTLAFLALIASPFWLPYALWLAAAAGCGHAPVAASNFAAAASYDLPGDRQYDVGIFPLTTPTYYCTEQEAKQAGFHHNPLDG